MKVKKKKEKSCFKINLIHIKKKYNTMRYGSLSAELDAITREFDYGIVPGSATVFVKDEENCIGRLDLTLLEGIMIVIEVTDQGYKVNDSVAIKEEE